MTEQEAVEKIFEADNPEQVEEILAQVLQITEEDQLSVVASAFRVLNEMQYEGLLNLALQYCYKLPERSNHWLSVYISDWLDELPYEEMQDKRNKVIEHILPELYAKNKEEPISASLHLAVVIGFRDDRLTEKIEELAGIHKPSTAKATIQDHALSSLGWLGYPNREKLIKRVVERLNAKDHQMYWLTMPVRMIASPRFVSSTIKLFQEHYNEHNSYDSLLWVLSDLALANPKSARKIWKTISSVTSSEMTRMISGAGNVTSQFDRAEIVDYFLKQLEAKESTVTGISPHYHIYLRLKDLESPAAIQAFHTSLLRHNEDVRKAFEQDIVLDTGQDTTWETDKSSIKRMACDLALRLKLDGVEHWLVASLQEINTFLCLDMAKLAGYVRAASAVHPLRKIIRNQPDNVPLGVSVLRSLGNIGTQSALDALFDSKVMVEDNVPQALPDSLAEVVLNIRNPEPLIKYVEDEQNKNMVLACSAALELVASINPQVLQEYRERIFLCLSKHNKPESLTTGYLAGALGFLDSSDVSQDTLELFIKLAESGEHGGGRALETLARWNHLHNVPHLLNGMGLERGKNGWYVADEIDFRHAFVVGLLYANHKQEFVQAICDILAKDDFFVGVQVMWQLQNETAETVSAEIVDALVARIRRQSERRRAETEALSALASCDANRLVKEFNHVTCSEWHASAREALVNCMRNVNKDEAATILRHFLSDPLSSIRRSAANALTERDQHILHEEVKHLLKSKSSQSRRAGVEASGWLDDNRLFNLVKQKARTDRESSVREAVRYAVSERRERTWATDYLQKVSCASDIRDIWVYGQALLNIGDEFTAGKLKSLSYDINLPSNQRAWLETLSEGVTKRWKEYVRRKEKE